MLDDPWHVFLWRLALDQKCTTPRQLLRRMTSREYTELKIFARHEVIGLDREDDRFARLGFALHHVQGGKSEMTDFLPQRIVIAPPEQSAEDMLAVLTAGGTLIPVDQHGNPVETVDPVGNGCVGRDEGRDASQGCAE